MDASIMEVISGLGLTGSTAILAYVLYLYKTDTKKSFDTIHTVLEMYRQAGEKDQKIKDDLIRVVDRQQGLTDDLKDIITLNTQAWQQVKTTIDSQECPLLKNACIESVSLAGPDGRKIGKAMNS
jgi:hypothetical protein